MLLSINFKHYFTYIGLIIIFRMEIEMTLNMLVIPTDAIRI